MKFLSKNLLPLAYPLCTLIFARPYLNFLLLFVLSIFGLFFLSLCSFQGACALIGAGGDNEIRTRDLLLARQALSQLSYTPKGFFCYFYSLFYI